MDNMDDTIGIVKTDTGVSTGGVGFLVIPDETVREQYIADCYRTQTVCINGGEGYGFFSAVRCPQSVLENLSFPTQNNRGTPVIWVKDGLSHLPVIVAWLRKEGDYYALEENQFRISRGTYQRSAEFFMDGNRTDIQLNLAGDAEQPASFDIKLTSKNKDSVFNLYCDGKLEITSDNEISLNTSGEVVVNIKSEGETKAYIKYLLGEGFTLNDEFNNVIKTSDGLVEIAGEKINHNEGKEPMVLGDTLSNLLDELLQAIQKLTVMTPVGSSSVPVNIADFASIQKKIKNIKSKTSNLD